MTAARALRAGALAGFSMLIVVGCGGTGGDGAPDIAAFEARIRERDGLTAAQAECVSSYFYEEYDPVVLRGVWEDGLAGVPLGQWNTYGHTYVGCLLHDELVGGPPR